jgi:hypothetical protein
MVSECTLYMDLALEVLTPKDRPVTHATHVMACKEQPQYGELFPSGLP